MFNSNLYYLVPRELPFSLGQGVSSHCPQPMTEFLEKNKIKTQRTNFSLYLKPGSLPWLFPTAPDTHTLEQGRPSKRKQNRGEVSVLGHFPNDFCEMDSRARKVLLILLGRWTQEEILNSCILLHLFFSYNNYSFIRRLRFVSYCTWRTARLLRFQLSGQLTSIRTTDQHPYN